MKKSIEQFFFSIFINLHQIQINYIFRRRVAKTNFIFDPREGIVLLEQKLPMPWHAFNRTPDFSEIAEYKMARDLIDTWVFSNSSLMSYYYLYKQYTNVYNLIPPFSGQYKNHCITIGYR